MGTPSTFLCPKMPKCCHNLAKKAEKDATRLMRMATKKNRNLGPINIGPLKAKVLGHKPVAEGGPRVEDRGSVWRHERNDKVEVPQYLGSHPRLSPVWGI